MATTQAHFSNIYVNVIKGNTNIIDTKVHDLRKPSKINIQEEQQTLWNYYI